MIAARIAAAPAPPPPPPPDPPPPDPPDPVPPEAANNQLFMLANIAIGREQEEEQQQLQEQDTNHRTRRVARVSIEGNYEPNADPRIAQPGDVQLLARQLVDLQYDDYQRAAERLRRHRRRRQVLEQEEVGEYQLPVIINYTFIRYIDVDMIFHDKGAMCYLCEEKKACTTWEKNGNAPNIILMCYDCPMTIRHIKRNPGTPWPLAQYMPTNITDADFHDGFKDAIRTKCTKLTFEHNRDIPKPTCNPFNNDPLLRPDFQAQFRSLSLNDSLPDDHTVRSNTDSQIGRGDRSGKMDITSVPGPYTVLRDAFIRVMKKYGMEMRRYIPMTNGGIRAVHCVMMNTFTKNGIQDTQVNYHPPMWDPVSKTVGVDFSKTNTTYIFRVVWLNHFFWIFRAYCLSTGTDKGAPKFDNYDTDHLCHNAQCKNPNHTAFSKRGRDNQNRNGCVGPPYCRHGENGTSCTLPGPYCQGGPNMGYIPNYDKLSQYILNNLPRVTVKMLGYPCPNIKQLTNVNFEQSCARTFEPDPIITKRSNLCYVCCKISERELPYTHGMSRQKILSGKPGYIYRQRLLKCSTCGILVCKEHRYDPLLVHHDKDYHSNQVTDWEARCISEYYSNHRRFT